MVSVIIYYGTTVVYAIRRWPKRRYALHTCTCAGNSDLVNISKIWYIAPCRLIARTSVFFFRETCFINLGGGPKCCMRATRNCAAGTTAPAVGLYVPGVGHL